MGSRARAVAIVAQVGRGTVAGITRREHRPVVVVSGNDGFYLFIRLAAELVFRA